MSLLARKSAEFEPDHRTVSPFIEIGAYEFLWLEPKTTFKRLADRFAKYPNALPSNFVDYEIAVATAETVRDRFHAIGVDHFGVRINRAGDYPSKLRHARHPIELLYFQGTWELSEKRSIAVVGSRKVSDDGIRRTRKLVAGLAERNFTIVSGLAEGVDTVAHTKALELGANTIAVIGTPLGHHYPKANRELQERIARDHLLISQVPLLRYSNQDWRINRGFFPERNATMSALTEATVIVEASDTSGTLTQARAALYQRRKLFILDSCFQRSDISWPQRFADQGAIRVKTLDDIYDVLK